MNGKAERKQNQNNVQDVKATPGNESLKMLGIVCMTILGLMTLIGVFFGKDGYVAVGISLIVFFMLCVMWIMSRV